MTLLVLLALSVLIGLLTGGRLTNLAGHRWRLPGLPLAALCLQILAFLPEEHSSRSVRLAVAALHSASYLVLLIFIWLNHRSPWLVVLGSGVAANALAIVVNGGFMPVSPGALLGTPNEEFVVRGPYNNSILMSGDTRLAFLADVLRTPEWFPLHRALSVGDVIIALGAFALVQQLMRRPLVNPPRE
jgi:hypothetical protein